VSFDVLVVGAGPAGSVAALVLASAGVKVRLVDRSQFPRDKLCGDTLNPGSLAILDRLGRGQSRPPHLGDAIRARALAITGMVVTGPGGASVASDYPHNLRGAAIVRRDLDLVLLEAAVAAGAEFIPDVQVRGPLMASGGVSVIGVQASRQGREESWQSRLVVAADGRGSRLASALKLAAFAGAPRRWAFGAYFAGVEGLTSRGEMHIRPDGYIGVAPVPGGLANVCVVKEVASGFSRRNVIAAAIAADPALAARFARAQQIAPIASLGPLAVEARAAGCPGLLLAGDAAGFVDPMTGDGLRFALRGGELAAEAALHELASGAAAFERLRAARVREFAGKWRVNRALRSLVAWPRGVEYAAAIASRWPAPVRALIGVAGDVHLAKQLTH
jgi:flavin-dependent dehydrogenase